MSHCSCSASYSPATSGKSEFSQTWQLSNSLSILALQEKVFLKTSLSAKVNWTNTTDFESGFICSCWRLGTKSNCKELGIFQDARLVFACFDAWGRKHSSEMPTSGVWGRTTAWLVVTMYSEETLSDFLCQVISDIRGGISEPKPEWEFENRSRLGWAGKSVSKEISVPDIEKIWNRLSFAVRLSVQLIVNKITKGKLRGEKRKITPQWLQKKPTAESNQRCG